MPRREHRARHLALLLTLLLLFAAGPWLVPYRQGVLILNIIAAAVLIAGTYALRGRRLLFATAIALSAISVLGTWLMLRFPRHEVVLLAHASIILLVGFFAVAILNYVFRSGRVTADKIFAAICVYFLIGYAWTFGYALLDETQPGSFVSLNQVSRNDYTGRIMQLRYFSFMTLTTVGYGDIVPRTPAARTLAMLEAISGQFYLGVLIARLVGLHIVHASDSAKAD